MKVKVFDGQNGGLSSKQTKTFRKFRRRLSEKVPEYRVVWVRPYNERIIEVGLESQKKIGYRKMQQMVKLAIEVGDEADLVIIPS
ncbi:MAG: hypothetical protein ONB46_03875 [candidate division KSB1 bacterium]|nr:hypothetical protein [candidate division KSB1 bacterium]MDZ7364940.1 hypothetical protein [candidate division KSB1 bacterium]MDZ7403335.1 hypothetical protein [candidate division KSB1 bacterium]